MRIWCVRVQVSVRVCVCACAQMRFDESTEYILNFITNSHLLKRWFNNIRSQVDAVSFYVSFVVDNFFCVCLSPFLAKFLYKQIELPSAKL